MAEFGHLDRGYSRVAAICEWTYEHLKYRSCSTDSSTGACDVLILRSRCVPRLRPSSDRPLPALCIPRATFQVTR